MVRPKHPQNQLRHQHQQQQQQPALSLDRRRGTVQQNQNASNKKNVVTSLLRLVVVFSSLILWGFVVWGQVGRKRLETQQEGEDKSATLREKSVNDGHHHDHEQDRRPGKLHGQAETKDRNNKLHSTFDDDQDDDHVYGADTKLEGKDESFDDQDDDDDDAGVGGGGARLDNVKREHHEGGDLLWQELGKARANRLSSSSSTSSGSATNKFDLVDWQARVEERARNYVPKNVNEQHENKQDSDLKANHGDKESRRRSSRTRQDLLSRLNNRNTPDEKQQSEGEASSARRRSQTASLARLKQRLTETLPRKQQEESDSTF